MSIWKDLGRRVGNIRQNIKAPELPQTVKRLPLPRAAAKSLQPRKKKYEYIEPEPSVLLNQKAVWDRIKGGESPEEALEASVSVLKVRHAPRISVIVATYEPVIRYFERTLISILSQTYGGFELIIADTSLSSAVRDLLDHYRDERIRYYSVPGNRGEASLINDAALMASGDYVCTVDVGDQLTKDALYEVFTSRISTRTIFCPTTICEGSW